MKRKNFGIICLAMLMLCGCTREKNDGYFTNQTAYIEKEDGWVHSLLINTVYNNEDEVIRVNYQVNGTNLKYKAIDDFYGVISDEEGNEIGRAGVPIPAYVYKKEYREETGRIEEFLSQNQFYRDITIDDLEPLELSIFDKQEIVDLYNEALDVDTSTKGPFALLAEANCLQQTLLDGSIIQLSYMSNNRYVTKLNLEYIYSDETYLSDLCEQETATPEQIEVQKDLDELEQRIVETQAYDGIDIDSPIDDKSYFNEQLIQLIDDSLSAKRKW